MDSETGPSGGMMEAPAWRRRVALALDLAAALSVFALFLVPFIAVQTYGGPAASTLKTFGWAYLGVMIVLAFAWAIKKKRRQRYVTIGLAIMDIRPVRVDDRVYAVRTCDAPDSGGGMSVRAASIVGGLLMVLAAGLLVYEAMLYG